MDNNKSDPLTPLFALIKYKELAKNPANHSEMIKDKTTINFLAYVLDNSDEEILVTSLDTLLLLSDSIPGIEGIRATFGVTEALNSIVKRDHLDESKVREKAMKLLDKLNSKPPSKTIPSRKKKILNLYVHGLHTDTQKELEDILTKKMKGIHSILVDVEHQKCTVTAYDFVDPKNLAQTLMENTGMEAKLISKNKYNQEILVSLLEHEKTLDLQDLPLYLDEKDSPVKEKAVRSAKEIRITASEWFCTAAGFLQRTFYW
ncbi:hypothetical protein RUM44_004834 [Polyplax serrata]|uniref:Armadillo repeat-containing protein 1 n=1 Tax=Polyplax serrata TaxID=468196 RepID=A0ABR1B3Y2_POLSC